MEFIFNSPIKISLDLQITSTIFKYDTHLYLQSNKDNVICAIKIMCKKEDNIGLFHKLKECLFFFKLLFI